MLIPLELIVSSFLQAQLKRSADLKPGQDRWVEAPALNEKMWLQIQRGKYLGVWSLVTWNSNKTEWYSDYIIGEDLVFDPRMVIWLADQSRTH